MIMILVGGAAGVGMGISIVCGGILRAGSLYIKTGRRQQEIDGCGYGNDETFVAGEVIQ
jgi:hypothetical protein